MTLKKCSKHIIYIIVITFLLNLSVFAQIKDVFDIGSSESYDTVSLQKKNRLSMKAFSFGPQKTPFHLDVVSKKGATLDGITPTGFGFPSINNRGKISFVSRTGNAIHGRVTAVTKLQAFRAFGVWSPATLSDFVQINDRDSIIWHQGFEDGFISYVKRLDNATNGDILGDGSYTPRYEAEYDKMLPWVSINNSGRGVFSALLGTGTLLSSRNSGYGTYTQSLLLNGYPAFFPMISDDNRIIVRGGTASNAPIILFTDHTFVTNVGLASSNGFNEIGDKPGISDDGRVSVFMADATSGGRGVFVTTLNSSFQGYQFQLIDVPKSSPLSFRVGVNKAGTGEFNYRVVYLGEDDSRVLGLYWCDVNVANPAAPVARDPVLIVQFGDVIDGLTGTVNYINVYDPVNNSGQVVFLVKTTTGEEAIVCANPDFNQIDQWWATIDDAPIDVTWLLSVAGTSGTDDYVLTISFDIPMNGVTTWVVPNNTNVAIRDAETESLIRNVRLTQVKPAPLSADIGTLEPDVYTFTIDGFTVPQRPIVQKINFRMYNSESVTAPYKELNALFAADHPTDGRYIRVKVPGNPVDNSYNHEQLVDAFAPILLFDDGSEGGVSFEKYVHPYDASEIFNNDDYLDEDVTGNTSQEMNLSAFAETAIPEGSPMIYGEVLRKSDVIARGMLPTDDSEPDEIAINYWFHYPRSNWGEHNGVNTHEGDWEGVTVFLTWNSVKGYFEPDRVAFAQHIKFYDGLFDKRLHADGGEIVEWSALSLDAFGDKFRHVVFVGLGGHASYYFRGETTYKTLKWPLSKKEYHRGNLSAFSANSSQVSCLVAIGDNQTEEWLRYPGHWGKLGIGETSSVAPPGPVFQSLGFGHGTRWLNPWEWSRGFNSVNSTADIQISGNCVVNGSLMTASSDISDTQFLWQDIELSPYADSVQFYIDFPQRGDGDVLEVTINDQVVGSILGEEFIRTEELQLSESFDISAYRNQVVSLALTLRQINPVPAQAVIRDVSIVNVDLADLELASVTYTPGTYVRGQEFPITIDVNNIGSFDVVSGQSYVINVVFSEDSVLDESDSTIGSLVVDEFLGAGLSSSIHGNITLPNDFQAGTYYLGIILDANEEVAELNENNNTFVSESSDVKITADSS
ncbi:CARDB domain-containing protein [Planctomycetota bacterium]